jgi:K+:H+ antiporter
VKGTAASIALRSVGCNWQSAIGMGIGLAQLGEFSFLLLLEGLRGRVISELNYNRTLFIALGTLILTPMLLRRGTRNLRREGREQRPAVELSSAGVDMVRVLVVGAGPIGRDVATFLETSGWRVSMIDLSPVNLHPFAQQGFETAIGDATERETLERAGIERMHLAIICLPNDEITSHVTQAIRQANPNCAVIARVRYLLNMAATRRAGAAEVICEEAEAARAILASVRRVIGDT